MTVKKIIVVLLMLGTMLSVTACGCEHQWVEANCTAAKHCAICNKQIGEPTEHHYQPDCDWGEWCPDCGLIRGEPLGHDFVEATCSTPKTCSRCGFTEGGTFEHEYNNGKCKNCGIEDPNYLVPEKFGFEKMYKMKQWVRLWLDQESGRAWTWGSYTSEYGTQLTYEYIEFYDQYYQRWKTYFSSKTDTSTSNKVSYSYNILSNDVMKCDGKKGAETVTIVKRETSNKSGLLAVELSSSQNELKGTYIPAALLDFSKIDYEIVETAPNGLARVKFYISAK
ncbi:MAG: hypothetical protein IKT35_00115 [Clostridia bacterium]|nr:hypothetical protein [Clostridia bacterium]